MEEIEVKTETEKIPIEERRRNRERERLRERKRERRAREIKKLEFYKNSDIKRYQNLINKKAETTLTG